MSYKEDLTLPQSHSQYFLSTCFETADYYIQAAL